MRWSQHGAHLLLQVRTRVFNEELRSSNIFSFLSALLRVRTSYLDNHHESFGTSIPNVFDRDNERIEHHFKTGIRGSFQRE